MSSLRPGKPYCVGLKLGWSFFSTLPNSASVTHPPSSSALAARYAASNTFPVLSSTCFRKSFRTCPFGQHRYKSKTEPAEAFSWSVTEKERVIFPDSIWRRKATARSPETLTFRCRLCVPLCIVAGRFRAGSEAGVWSAHCGPVSSESFRESMAACRKK